MPQYLPQNLPLAEDLVHADAPARNRRLCVRDLTSIEYNLCMHRRYSITIHARAARIDVPNHQRARFKVIKTFGRHLKFGLRAIVALASNLRSKCWRAGNEFHRIARRRAEIKGYVW